MSKIYGRQTSWIAGISFSEKQGAPNSYAFGKSIDHRSDPKALTILPKAVKDSGSIVTDLPMWGIRACNRIFAYGDSGKIYMREDDVWSLVHTAADSQGNGLGFFSQDGHMYYTQNTTFGRLTDACTGLTFYDDFKSSEGGEPTNTKSLELQLASSQYASRADTATTSLTGDLTLEAYCKLASLPATNDIQTIISKWDENSDNRSYKMDITTSSDFFGDGSDGALTISSNTTETVIDANCTGTVGTNALTISNSTGTFSAGDKIMIHQTRGANAGTYQLTAISNIAGTTITTEDILTFSPSHSAVAGDDDKAQVRVLKQYTDVTINSGVTYTAKVWNGLKGGIIGWYASGTTTITGTIDAGEKGFRGGASGSDNGGVGESGVWGSQGEGTGGEGVEGDRTSNGNGGGAAYTDTNIANDAGAGGGGGGNATAGQTGYWGYSQNQVNNTYGLGGESSGASDLSTMTFGGGGGGGGLGSYAPAATTEGRGGTGGGIVAIFSTTYTVTGEINVDGQDGYGKTGDQGAGGAGAAGSILLKSQTATLGTDLHSADKGLGGDSSERPLGNASDGRIHLDYSDSYTGSTTPAITITEDVSLGAGDGYVLRLLVSNDGAASETYSWNITNNLDTSTWVRWAISWDSSLSIATAYRNGVSLGEQTGNMTSIDDNASDFAIGCSFDGTSTAENFYDGLIDDVRLWRDLRTPTELVSKNNQKLFGTEADLNGYWEFEDDLTDSQTDGLNDLTGTNSPTYSADVPFSGVTSRGDEDQNNSGGTGQTYTPPTAINEDATNRQTFVPEKDPQKSIEIDIDTVGTGDWTVTVHDAINREVANVTIANSQLHTGIYEFTFDSVWRPKIGSTYHFHVTSTVADGVLVTGTLDDLEDGRFWSHYQFLVDDKFHPIIDMLDFMVFGNERYVAKFEAGDAFNPKILTLPAGYRVRCFAKWREYLAIGVWLGTDITDYETGYVFFWDGIKDTYNHYIPIPEGGVNAMYGLGDVLFIVAGYTGEILVYSGVGAAQKLNKIPNIESDEYIEVAPGAINMWRTYLHYGSDYNTDSESVFKGVYSIGTSNRSYPTSMGFDYPTSLGDQTSSGVKIGMIYPSGQNLYISWQNNNTYGIDRVNTANNVYANAELYSLINDVQSISKEKYPLILRADFERLKAGESIGVKYKLDRNDLWSTSVTQSTLNATSLRFRIPKRCKEIQYGVELATTSTTSPKLIGVTLEVEREERSRKNA